MMALADVDGDGRVRPRPGCRAPLAVCCAVLWREPASHPALPSLLSLWFGDAPPPSPPQIDLPEFVAATLGRSVVHREDFLRRLFTQFDANGDELISPGGRSGVAGRQGGALCSAERRR